MIDNTEPIIDEIFDAIEIFDGDDSNGREYQAGYNDMALACRLMKEQIRIEVKQAVSDQVAKARIDELERLLRPFLNKRVYSSIQERIAKIKRSKE